MVIIIYNNRFINNSNFVILLQSINSPIFKLLMFKLVAIEIYLKILAYRGKLMGYTLHNYTAQHNIDINTYY